LLQFRFRAFLSTCGLERFLLCGGPCLRCETRLPFGAHMCFGLILRSTKGCRTRFRLRERFLLGVLARSRERFGLRLDLLSRAYGFGRTSVRFGAP
jgi:hypothetical protein